MKRFPDELLTALGQKPLRSRIAEAMTSTATPPETRAPDLRDLVRLAEGADIAEATALAILEMIKAAGPASLIHNDFVPKSSIVITCHPDVYAHVRRMIEQVQT